MHEHVTDVYVQRSKAEGYRSRAAYILMEIADRDRLIRPGDTVVDLGAAPGGWSQVVAKRLSGRGRIVALDLLEMAPIHGVDFIQGDFREDDVLQQLENLLGGICDHWQALLGVLLLGIVLFAPGGVMGLTGTVMDMVKGRGRKDA